MSWTLRGSRAQQTTAALAGGFAARPTRGVPGVSRRRESSGHSCQVWAPGPQGHLSCDVCLCPPLPASDPELRRVLRKGVCVSVCVRVHVRTCTHTCAHT